MQHQVDQLWDIAYREFEKRIGSANNALFANKAQSNEIQHRMMRTIAALKAPDARVAALIETLMGDILLAESLGFITAEGSQQMQQIIGEIGE